MKGAKNAKQQPLGAAVKKLRAELGITAAELAKRAGLSRSYVSYVETGRFKDIGVENFVRLALALEVSVDQLLSAAGYLPAERETFDIRVALRRQLGLKGRSLEQAMDFLRFLTDPNKRAAARSQS